MFKLFNEASIPMVTSKLDADNEELLMDDITVVPDKQAFKSISRHYNAYKRAINTKQTPAWIDEPINLASSIKNSYKKIQYYYAALILGWADLADELKKRLKQDGYTKADMQKISELVSRYTDAIVTYANEHPLIESLLENIEKQDKLNPKLYLGKHLIADVREKLLDITKAFTNELTLNNINIDILDIILTGSNASYNYTKKSDIDLHIIANSKTLKCSKALSSALYSAYRSIFNTKLEIDFYGIPVEIYVELDKTDTKSNGIYSVLKDSWIKEPIPMDIPKIDTKQFNKEFEPWETAYKAIKEKVKKNELLDEAEIVQFINDIYAQRQEGLKTEGEYSIKNLIFKEFRNKDYLDDLKALRDEVLSKRLSLDEALNTKKLGQASRQIVKAIGYSVDVRKNGHFTINQVSEGEVNSLVTTLKQLDFVQSVDKREGSYSINNNYNPYKRPEKYYTIVGQIKDF